MPLSLILLAVVKTAEEIAISQIILGINSGIAVYAATKRAQQQGARKKR